MKNFTLVVLLLSLIAGAQASIFNNRWEQNFEHSEYFTYTLVGLGMLVGVVVCFLGYKLFKPVLFILGFIIGAGVCYYILWYYTKVGLIVLIGAPILSGIGLGLVLLFVMMAGIFLMGAILGFLLFCVIVSARDGGLIHNSIALWVGMGASALIGGIIALIFQKTLIIFATSFGGAYAVVAGADRFVHGGFSLVIGQLLGNSHHLIDATYKTYIEMGACVLLAFIGVIVQFRVTGKNVYHRPQQHEDDGYYALNG